MASFYLTKLAFDTIEKRPNSIEFKILSKQTEIFLDLPEEDVKSLMSPKLAESGKFETNNLLDFQQDYNVKFSAGKDIFDKVRGHNYDSLLEIPDGIFVFNVNDSITKYIKEKYGVICMSDNCIDFSELTKSHTKYCEREEKIKGNEIDSRNVPTHYNISEIFPHDSITPCNSIIVIDKYLFKDDPKGENIVEILKQLIPNTLEDKICHVLIVFELKESSIEARKKEFTTFNDTAINGNIVTEISKIHGKSVSVEFIAGTENSQLFEDMHNRNIITNYEIISAEHGFGLYKKGKMKFDQKISIQALYSDGLDGQSHTPEHGRKYILKKVKNIIEYAKERFSKDYPQTKEEKGKLTLYDEPQYRFSQNGKSNPCKISPNDVINRLIKF